MAEKPKVGSTILTVATWVIALLYIGAEYSKAQSLLDSSFSVSAPQVAQVWSEFAGKGVLVLIVGCAVSFVALASRK